MAKSIISMLLAAAIISTSLPAFADSKHAIGLTYNTGTVSERLQQESGGYLTDKFDTKAFVLRYEHMFTPKHGIAVNFVNATLKGHGQTLDRKALLVMHRLAFQAEHVTPYFQYGLGHVEWPKAYTAADKIAITLGTGVDMEIDDQLHARLGYEFVSAWTRGSRPNRVIDIPSLTLGIVYNF